MEKSKSIRAKWTRIALCVAAVITLTGCQFADRLRPDLNFNADVRVYMIEEELGDEEVQPGQSVSVASYPSTWPVSGQSPNTGGFTYTPANPNVNVEEFATTPYAMIEATDYGTYLREQVYDKVVDIVEGLGDGVSKKVYIRFGHTGYDYNAGTMRKVSGWSGTTAGSAFNTSRVVGGSTLITLANDWVGDSSKNTNYQATQVSQAYNILNAYVDEEDMDKDWYALAEDGIPAAYYSMFGRDGADFTTFQQYYDAIEAEPHLNIPNYGLYYYTGGTTTDRLIFNKHSGSSLEQYVPGVSTDTVNKLFSTYNQYPKRDREQKDATITDSSSLLRYYLDGYNKTVMFVGTTSGENLQDVLGTLAYREIFELINGAFDCTETSSITSIVAEVPDVEDEVSVTDYSRFTIIPAGSKGVD